MKLQNYKLKNLVFIYAIKFYKTMQIKFKQISQITT